VCRFWRLAKIPILPDDYSKETSGLIELGKKVHKGCEILVCVAFASNHSLCEIRLEFARKKKVCAKEKSQDERRYQDINC